jgi:very-short-patch-repair endonuclease
MLQFHYRSRHESLIAVSNKEFYDNNLNVFPSPDAGRENTGLVFNHLPDTTYDRGGSRKNKGEAEVVAQRVMEHARTEPEMSLGVATFSSAQQEAIRDRLEYERRQDPSCEDFFSGHPDEPFFVKNLESVQGDQRDIIFISVGYGRDDNGKVSMNFGPLNQEGGERRLNVLTTRAKHRCEVFTNLRGDDIDLHRTDARGVEVLKEYLTFAETGELDLPTPTGRGPDSPFEEAVAERLRAEGYRVEHQVRVAGFYIDLAVVDPDRPGRYVLGIECDGATYHSAKMARVRDRTRQAVLENLGWTIHRIWSTDWFRRPGEQLGQAVAVIERAKVGPTAASDGSAASNGDPSSNGQTAPSDAAANQGGLEDQGGPEKTDGAATSSPERSDGEAHSPTSSGEKHTASGEDAEKRSSQEAPSQEQPSRDGTSRDGPPQERKTEIQRSETEDTDTGAPPYERVTLDIHVREGLRDEPTATIGQWIETVVAQEGPVHEEVAMRRVLDATDVSRMGSRIREALEDGIRYAARKNWVEKSHKILFDPDQSTVPVRDRSDLEGPARDIHHVPNLEIAAAARKIAEISFGIEKEELIRETGRTLGFNRIGSNIQDRIGSVIDAMIEQERLVSEDGHLRVPE